MDNWVIRRAQPSDLEAIVAFNLAMAWETEQLKLSPDILRAGVRAVLEDSAKGFYFVAATGDEVIGQLMITFEWSDWRNAMWWWIQSVYVRPDSRRRGIYRALYAEAIERGRQSGIHGLRLYVERENQVAQQTYSQLGMKQGRYVIFETTSD